MRIDPRRVLTFLVVAGFAGAVLFLPTISFIGNMLTPSRIAPASAEVPPLLSDAIWARANGGRATSLQPLNPFSIGRTVSCMILAERLEQPERDARQEECMALLPGMAAIGYLSSVHMRGEGVWEDPRVPFVQIAHMHGVTQSWTREQLIDTLAARAEFGRGVVGAEAAARLYFGRAMTELTLPQAALLAAALGDGRVDPWCDAAQAATQRRRVLDRMRNNGAIDAATFEGANTSELGLTNPPPGKKPCE